MKMTCMQLTYMYKPILIFFADGDCRQDGRIEINLNQEYQAIIQIKISIDSLKLEHYA